MLPPVTATGMVKVMFGGFVVASSVVTVGIVAFARVPVTICAVEAVGRLTVVVSVDTGDVADDVVTLVVEITAAVVAVVGIVAVTLSIG